MSRAAPHVLAAAAVAALAASAAAPARAQGPAIERRLGPGTASGEPRWQGGLSFTLTQPVHEFHEAVPNRGIGGAGHGLFRVGASGALALRADAGFVQYGRERQRVPLFGVGRITADLVTTNSIFTFGVGPQLMAPSGVVRPYVNGNVGFAVFSTSSELRDRSYGSGDDDGVIARQQNQSSGTLAGGGEAGFLVRLGRSRRSLSFLDVGARYQNNGSARYLTKGDIVDNPDGSVSLREREGPANFWTYHVGLSFGGR